MKRLCFLLSVLAIVSGARAETSIKDVLAKIDPTTGKAADTATEFTISGIVSARATLPDGQVIAFVQPSGEAGVPVLATTADGAGLVPRNAVTLSGRLAPGPLGWAGLQLKAGSLTVGGTNRPFGLSEPQGAEFFKDASSLAGRYVQLTNVTFTSPKFDTSGTAKVKSESGVEVTLIVGKPAAGRDTPKGPLNVFGVPVKKDGAWHLLASRLLSTNVRAMQNLATKYTCFTCHNPDTKLIGPAYREVAAKYRNDPGAAAKLIAQMENGGSGKWGPVPMLPFKGKIPPADMQLLAEWVLGYRWDALLAE